MLHPGAVPKARLRSYPTLTDQVKSVHSLGAAQRGRRRLISMLRGRPRVLRQPVTSISFPLFFPSPAIRGAFFCSSSLHSPLKNSTVLSSCDCREFNIFRKSTAALFNRRAPEAKRQD